MHVCFASMAPKYKPRRGLHLPRAIDLLSDEQLRAQYSHSSTFSLTADSTGPHLTAAPEVPPPLADISACSASATSPAAGAVKGCVPDAARQSASSSFTTAVRARSDVPLARNVRRGGVEVALDSLHTTGASELVAALVRDRESAAGRGGRLALLNTWQRFHDAVFSDAPVAVLPLTPQTLIGIGAMFKAGGYRSFPNYLSAAKTWHIEQGYDWTDQLELTAKWVSRSALRGIGPARQSCPFRLPRLMALPRTLEALTPGGPQWPVTATFLGSYAPKSRP